LRQFQLEQFARIQAHPHAQNLPWTQVLVHRGNFRKKRLNVWNCNQRAFLLDGFSIVTPFSAELVVMLAEATNLFPAKQ
jgi:hypothetical protein